MKSSLFTPRLLWLVIGGTLAICIVGCIPDSTVSRKWKEDVLLDDGTTIVVKRTVKFRETNSLSGDAYNAVERDATLEFTGDLVRLPKWRAPLMALLLYRDGVTSEWVLVATTTSCDQWNRLGAPQVMYLPDRPNTMYWEYRIENGEWREVPLSKASVGRPVNLLHRYQQELGTSHVTVQFRHERETGPRPPMSQFLRIDERPEASCNASVENRQKRAAKDNPGSQKEVVEE